MTASVLICLSSWTTARVWASENVKLGGWGYNGISQTYCVMIPVMEMVCVIEESGEVSILETVEAVVKVLLMKTSAVCVIAFIVTVEVGQQIPLSKDDSISD